MKQAIKHFEAENKKLELMLIIFPHFKAGFLYDKIKQLGDRSTISHQCCLKTCCTKTALTEQVVGTSWLED